MVFERGQTVVRREILRGEVWFASPQICVHDDGDLLVTYTPEGTPFGFPQEGRFPAGRHPWEAAGRQSWTGHGCLDLQWTGVEHAIFLFWSGPERQFRTWYFNLQDAPRRTPIGFDTLDHELDLVLPVDAETYRWKDVEEFAAVGELRYPGRSAEIQAEGDRIAGLLDAGKRWWDEAWADWTPDPSWTARELPADWATTPFEAR
ncbi:DUF402 domain-containing protein [Antribacter gilvus]|uniref:DUF402 domain-containing protein n=1 Tax=Antribacter gilvus TaxID=2304675 RepID=UPI000F7B1FA6|nr:DUF402 domain-containing protein [Antribacter gilvus]